ncbi:MAG: hypothetical protein ACTTH0_04225 [Eubacteriales bacterium]
MESFAYLGKIAWYFILSAFLLVSFIAIKGLVRKTEDDAKIKEIIGLVLSILGIAVSVLGIILGQGNIYVNQEDSNQSLNITGGMNIVNTNYYDNLKSMEKELSESENLNLDKYKDITELNEWIVGWGDSNGGRKSYTLEEINEGKLDDKIVLNSISNSTIGHEFNFVSARENIREKDVKKRVWKANEIEVRQGQTYRIRLYVHNNNPNKLKATAKNVTAKFLISNPVRVTKNDIAIDGFNSANGYYGVAVHGILYSDNANPNKYWDGVKFVSDRPFELKYVDGTAIMENNGMGGISLSDDILTGKGILLGYDKLDGEIPGGYQYAAYISIVVMPIFK